MILYGSSQRGRSVEYPSRARRSTAVVVRGGRTTITLYPGAKVGLKRLFLSWSHLKALYVSHKIFSAIFVNSVAVHMTLTLIATGDSIRSASGGASCCLGVSGKRLPFQDLTKADQFCGAVHLYVLPVGEGGHKTVLVPLMLRDILTKSGNGGGVESFYLAAELEMILRCCQRHAPQFYANRFENIRQQFWTIVREQSGEYSVKWYANIEEEGGKGSCCNLCCRCRFIEFRVAVFHDNYILLLDLVFGNGPSMSTVSELERPLDGIRHRLHFLLLVKRFGA